MRRLASLMAHEAPWSEMSWRERGLSVLLVLGVAMLVSVRA